MLRAVIAWGIAALALLASIASLTVWAGTPLDIVTFVTCRWRSAASVRS